MYHLFLWTPPKSWPLYTAVLSIWVCLSGPLPFHRASGLLWEWWSLPNNVFIVSIYLKSSLTSKQLSGFLVWQQWPSEVWPYLINAAVTEFSWQHFRTQAKEEYHFSSSGSLTHFTLFPNWLPTCLDLHSKPIEGFQAYVISCHVYDVYGIYVYVYVYMMYVYMYVYV